MRAVVGVMGGEEVSAAAGAARERLESRRNRRKGYTEAERRAAWVRGEELPRADPFAPQFRPPETLAEWLDDVVIQWAQMRGFPEAPLIVAVAEAARVSAAAACTALKAARDLPPAVQWVVFQNVRDWRTVDRAERMGADRLALALLAEWSRLKLPEEDPAAKPEPRRRRRRWEAEGAA